MTRNTPDAPDPRPPAVVLLSGGLDSAVTAAVARSAGRDPVALTFDYGQRHRAELAAAGRVAEHIGAIRHVVMPLDLRLVGGSALTGDQEVPKDADPNPKAEGGSIPVTYVPARNLTFLSIAAGLAEVAGAREVWIGVNAVDYSGYPDCRPNFIRAFELAANLGTKAGSAWGGRGLDVRTPLIDETKADIVKIGLDLGVDLGLTHSCYDPPDVAGTHCGRCEACALRRRGFIEAGAPDPTRYAGG